MTLDIEYVRLLSKDTEYTKYLLSGQKMSVLLETTLGDLVIDLYTEARPRCAVNFLKLCKAKFYKYYSLN